MNIRVFLSCRDRPIDYSFHGFAEIARHELFFVNSAVDGRSRLPFPVLVVGHPVFRDYFASFVDRLLQLNIERRDQDSWNSLDFMKWKRESESPRDVIVD